MGSTLETVRIQAESWTQARDIVIEKSEYYYGADPYSGHFNTIIDWVKCKKPFSDAEEFEDWVCEYGDKREAFVWTKDNKTYYICGWCAC